MMTSRSKCFRKHIGIERSAVMLARVLYGIRYSVRSNICVVSFSDISLMTHTTVSNSVSVAESLQVILLSIVTLNWRATTITIYQIANETKPTRH